MNGVHGCPLLFGEIRNAIVVVVVVVVELVEELVLELVIELVVIRTKGLVNDQGSLQRTKKGQSTIRRKRTILKASW